MQNTDYTFAYWREIYRKAFVVSLRAVRQDSWRTAKQSNFFNILLVSIGLFMILVLGFTSFGFAEKTSEVKKEAKGDKEEITDLSVMKEIEGEVSAVDKHGIAVVYDIDNVEGVEKEIYLPLDTGNTKLTHKRNLNEIQLGDKVRVNYDEEILQQGNKTETKFKAKEIIFLRPSQRKLVVPEIEVESEDTLEGTLPFKGIE